MSSDRQKFANAFADEIRRFNQIIETGSVADDQTVKNLSSALSRLLDFGERCPDAWSDNKVEAPKQDTKAIQSMVDKRFPEFGVYNSSPPDSTPVDKAEIYVDDAADDVYDIYRDLNEALWYFEKGYYELGLWSAKLLFGHWGRHAINLKSYLHKKAHDW